jgi:hypothetical protein
MRGDPPEMTSDSTNLLLEDLVIESSLKLSLPTACRGDVHSSLATSKYNKILLGCNSRAVERSVGNIGLHDFKVGSVDKLSQVSMIQGAGKLPTFALLSFEAVMKYVRSGAHCKSVIRASNS